MTVFLAYHTLPMISFIATHNSFTYSQFGVKTNKTIDTLV